MHNAGTFADDVCRQSPPSDILHRHTSMAFKRDNQLTAVRVRGKRRAAIPEKWTAGKRRDPELQKRPAPLDQPTKHALEQLSRSRKRKRAHDESPLERLPVEVLHQVFEYSANIELPLVSRELATKLSKSKHLQHQLTTQVLGAVLGCPDASFQELTAATRLLNSKFMTWTFFTAWLKTQVASAGLTKAPEGAWTISSIAQAWLALQPPSALLPPKKLLSSPFNQEKVRFLHVLGQNIVDLTGMDSTYGELGYDGLCAAVRQGQTESMSLMLSMGLSPSTEMLRVAVAESGCNEEVVRMLVDAACDDGRRRPSAEEPSPVASEYHFDAVDLLDPVLWAWADEARKCGNKKGDWLLGVLKTAQQRRRYASRDE